jgi:hypothetical protein
VKVIFVQGCITSTCLRFLVGWVGVGVGVGVDVDVDVDVDAASDMMNLA